MSDAVRRALGLLVAATVLVGCGGDDDQPTAPSAPPPSGRTATSAPGAQDRPAAPRTTPEAAPVPGGSERVRVPATFTLRGGRLTPPTVRVPPFLAVEISVRDTGGGGAQTVVIGVERPVRLRLPTGGRASVTLPGQPPGRYPVTAGRARAVLVVGGEPGP